MEALKSRESVSYHEQELKHGIRMQYAIKNKKDYVYIISYERAATDGVSEYYRAAGYFVVHMQRI